MKASKEATLLPLPVLFHFTLLNGEGTLTSFAGITLLVYLNFPSFKPRFIRLTKLNKSPLLWQNLSQRETVIDYLYPSKQNSPKVSLGQEVGGRRGQRIRRREGYGFQAVYCSVGYINQSVWV